MDCDTIEGLCSIQWHTRACIALTTVPLADIMDQYVGVVEKKGVKNLTQNGDLFELRHQHMKTAAASILAIHINIVLNSTPRCHERISHI